MTNIITNKTNKSTNYSDYTPDTILPVPNFKPQSQIKSRFRATKLHWDQIPRANNHNKPLQEKAINLLSTIVYKLRVAEVIILNHNYLSRITKCKKDQNVNLLKQLADILDISFHVKITIDGTIYRNSYVIKHTEAGRAIIENRKILLSQKHFVGKKAINPIKTIDKEQKKESPCTEFFSSPYIYKEEILKKNRSNDRNDFLGEEKTETNQDETKTESKIALTSSHTTVPTEADEAKAPLKTRPQAKAKSVEPKFLADFYPADEQTCELLRERSGRDFSNRFINQLLLAMSKKPSRAVFYHLNGFLSYFAKVLTYEKRDATACSSVDFYLKANMSDALKEELAQKKAKESYLLALEESKTTDAMSHMRKKIAQSWPRLLAYEFLQSWQSLSLQNDGTLKLRLNTPVFLSEHQQDRLQELAREAYSLFPGRAGQAVVACKLEVQESPRESKGVQKTQREEVPSACTTTVKAEPAKDPLSEQFQAKITQLLGVHIAKHWFKACQLVLNERENGNKATLLLVPNGLHQDWLERNYYKEINQVINQLGFKEVIIQTIS